MASQQEARARGIVAGLVVAPRALRHLRERSYPSHCGPETYRAEIEVYFSEPPKIAKVRFVNRNCEFRCEFLTAFSAFEERGTARLRVRFRGAKVPKPTTTTHTQRERP